MASSRARELVEQVIANPAEVMSNDDPSLAELVGLGPEAVHAIADAIQGTELRAHHPHELVQALNHVLSHIAEADPAPLLEHLDPADPNAMVFVFALGNAKPTREVVAALARMVTCEDATIRYAAANALVCLATPEAAQALVPALGDAYPPVQAVAVQAVSDNMTFRLPEAIEPLRRIVSDSRLKRTAPETWEQAKSALQEMA